MSDKSNKDQSDNDMQSMKACHKKVQSIKKNITMTPQGKNR